MKPTASIALAFLVAATALALAPRAAALTSVHLGDAVAKVDNPTATGTRFFALRTANDAAPQQDRAWDLAPGASLTLYYRTWTTGISPPNPPDGLQAEDRCILTVRWGTATTILRQLHSALTCPPDGTTYTFYATATGQAAGTPQAGTVRLTVQVIETVAGSTVYNVYSDVAGQGGSGALRFGLNVANLDANPYPAGNLFAATVAGEAIAYTLTGTPKGTDQGASQLTVRLKEGATTVATAAATYGATTAQALFTVGDALPPRLQSLHPEVEVAGTHPLTGLLWTYFNTVAAPAGKVAGFVVLNATVQADPRLTVVHLFQVDDPNFSTPPLGKGTLPRRSPMEAGFLATRIQNARGEPLDSAVAVTTTLRDAHGVVAPVVSGCSSNCLAVRGGQPGWTDFTVWTNGGPVGAWNKTADVTAPSHLDDALLVGAVQDLEITRLESGGGDPLKLTISPARAHVGEVVVFALAESYLNGTTRTGNAAQSWLRVYDPAGAIILPDTHPIEVGYGGYRLNYTPTQQGVLYVLARTRDPETGLDVATTNVFQVAASLATAPQLTNATLELGRMNASLAQHRELSPEYTADDLVEGNRTILADVAWLLWIAFVALTRLLPQKPLRLASILVGYAVLALPLSAFAFLALATLQSCVVIYDLVAVIRDRR
jgi:hypothetical protein